LLSQSLGNASQVCTFQYRLLLAIAFLELRQLGTKMVVDLSMDTMPQ
jgi:hypothetical protein